MVLADEGLNGKIVAGLRKQNIEVTWILEEAPGISDKAVIEYAKTRSQILITEDKDFGEWVFAHNVEGVTTIMSHDEFFKKLLIQISFCFFQSRYSSNAFLYP